MKRIPEVLMQRFEARFEERLRELARLALEDDRDGLVLAFHSLAGIGGTYGYPEITRVAREVEEELPLSGTLPVWRAISELERMHHELRSRRDRETAPPGMTVH